MKKFEYITKTCALLMSSGELNEFGNKGWELISCIIYQDAHKCDKAHYLFKKEINE